VGHRFGRTSAGLAVIVLLAATATGVAQDSLHMTARSIYAVPGMRDVWGYESNGREYALVCLGDRLEIVDCTDPDSVFLADVVLSTSGDLKDVKTYLNYAYAINQFGPMQIINLANPTAAFTEAHFSTAAMPSGHNIYIDQAQGYAYPTLNGSGARDMRILDLNFPLSPVEVGHYEHPNQGNLFADAHDAFARNDTAWVSYLDGGFAILDVSNKNNPRPFALVSYPGSTNHQVWMGPSGDFVYTTDERVGGHVRVWDTRDMRDIREAASYSGGNPSASVHNVHLKGDFCFVSYYTEGVRVLDTEDPSDPIEVAYYDTYVGSGLFAGCWGVYPYTTSGIIYGSDRTNGLFVLDWDSTTAGRVQGTVTTGHDGLPAAGVYVIKQSLGRIHVSDAAGDYLWRIGAGTDTLIFERPGFRADTQVVTGVLGTTLTLDVELQPFLTAQVTGTITTATGLPVAGARVGVAGEELFDVITDAGGGYVLDYVLAFKDQVITAAAWGYLYDTATVNLPLGGHAVIDFVLERGYQDTYELDLGWTTGANDDDATAGLWERVDPVGTQNFAAYQTQPEDDFDTVGSHCLITGQALPGDQITLTDVDGGHTSIVSPYFDLTGITDPVLSLRYWYVNNAGSSPNRDTLFFELSADSGQTWVGLFSTRFSLNNWWPLTRSLSTYQSWPQPLLFRVRAVDSGDESTIEVGIDAFAITGTYLDPQAGDMNSDFTVNSADIIYLVNFVFKGGPAPVLPATGDVNGSCTITSGDIIHIVNFVFKAGAPPQPPC